MRFLSGGTRLARLSCLLLLIAVSGCLPAPVGLIATAQLGGASELPSGKILFVREGNIWLWSEGRSRQLTDGGTWRQPQWSPDGTQIAYVYRSTNFSELFVMRADGTDHRRLTRSQSTSLGDNDWVFRPTWSPDGSQIAFTSDAGSYHPVVWVMNADGSAKRQLLSITSLQEAADSMSWSPDGKRLAVTVFGHDVSQIALLDAARGVSQPFTDHSRGALDPTWSPDGTQLAYVVREAGRTDIRIRALDALVETRVGTDGLARAPVWAPGGGRLAYLSARGGSFDLYTVDVSSEDGRVLTGNERQLTREFNIDGTSGLSWSS
jgi:TolB protein